MSIRTAAGAMALLGLLAAGRPSVCADGPQSYAGQVAWLASSHKAFFNYQIFLLSHGLKGVSDKEWSAMSAADQREKIGDDEKFLHDWLEAHISQPDKMTDRDHEMVVAVWGEPMARQMDAVRAAETTKDPRQQEHALKGVAELAAVAGMPIDLQGAAFTGEGRGGPPGALPHDYLAVKEKQGFLSALKDQDTAGVLESQHSFNQFINERVQTGQIVPIAGPGLEAMYQVLSKAEGKEKAEVGHILPTVVHFLKEGKKIGYDEKESDAFAYAGEGEYDSAERVNVTGQLKTADPVLVGDTLAHEFQHVYDDYAGRRYSVDSEMRGFKVEVMFMRVLQKAAPEKYKSLTNGSDEERRYMTDVERSAKAYEKGPKAFNVEVAWGHHYTKADVNSTIAEGRFPLLDAVDPRFGTVQALGAAKELRDNRQKEAADLQKQVDALAAKLKVSRSRALEADYEKAVTDLDNAKSRAREYDNEVGLREMRLRRMQAEAAWLKKKDPKASYDLFLPVDDGYVTP